MYARVHCLVPGLRKVAPVNWLIEDRAGSWSLVDAPV